MRDSPPGSNALVIQPTSHAHPETRSHKKSEVGQFFCQVYDLIAARNGRAQRSAPSPDNTQQSRYLESQLKAAHGALARARDSIAHVELRLEAERAAREAAEEQARADQHACNEAMRLLDQSVQPLRELQAAAAEQRALVQAQARAYAKLAARHRALETQLKEMDLALARAEYIAQRHADRHAQLIAELAAERAARHAAEAELNSHRPSAHKGESQR